MDIEKIGVGGRLGMMGLKNRGLIEIAEEPKSGGFVLIIGKGTRDKWYRKWLKVNIPNGMWRVRCTKEEVPDALNKFLSEEILK